MMTAATHGVSLAAALLWLRMRRMTAAEWQAMRSGAWECPACRHQFGSHIDAAVDACSCDFSGPLRQPLSASASGGSSRGAQSSEGVTQ